MIAREWIVTKMQTKSAGYQKNVLRRFELYLFPWIGKRAITETNAPELLSVIERIENQNNLKLTIEHFKLRGRYLDI